MRCDMPPNEFNITTVSDNDDLRIEDLTRTLEAERDSHSETKFWFILAVFGLLDAMLLKPPMDGKAITVILFVELAVIIHFANRLGIDIIVTTCEKLKDKLNW